MKKETIKTIAKGEGERAEQAREIIRINKGIDSDYLPRPVDKEGQSIATKLIKC